MIFLRYYYYFDSLLIIVDHCFHQLTLHCCVRTMTVATKNNVGTHGGHTTITVKATGQGGE